MHCRASRCSPQWILAYSRLPSAAQLWPCGPPGLHVQHSCLQSQAHTLPSLPPLLPTQPRTVVMDCVRRAFEAVFGRSARKLGMRTVYDVSHNLAKVETHQG